MTTSFEITIPWLRKLSHGSDGSWCNFRISWFCFHSGIFLTFQCVVVGKFSETIFIQNFCKGIFVSWGGDWGGLDHFQFSTRGAQFSTRGGGLKNRISIPHRNWMPQPAQHIRSEDCCGFWSSDRFSSESGMSFSVFASLLVCSLLILLCMIQNGSGTQSKKRIFIQCMQIAKNVDEISC